MARLAGIQAQVIAGIIVEKGDPGRLPTAFGGLLATELTPGVGNAACAHQIPILFKTADQIAALPVVPGEQGPQFLGEGTAQGGLEDIEVGRAGTREKSLVIARAVLAEPTFKAA
jgi:hypothetical protein